jgi:hypothetical protein
MRDKPFENTESTTELPERDYPKISLADRLAPKGKPQGAAKQPAAEIPPNPEPENTNEPEEQGPQSENTDDFEEFEEKVHKTLKDTDAVEIAEMIVSVGNIGRVVFMPGIYEGFMYPGQERNDIRDIMRRSYENEKNNEEPDHGFNNYDKRLFNKWGKLQDSIQNISFTEPEIKTLAKYLARQIGEMSVAVWMEKYMWLLYWIYLETKHASPIIGGRSSDFFAKKFGS